MLPVMTVRLIPERTVDSLLAYELLSAFSAGVIWFPTNTRGVGPRNS